MALKTVTLSVSNLFHPPVVERIKTSFARFSVKDNKEKGLFD